MYRIDLIRKTRLFYNRRFNNKTHHGDNMRLRTKLMTIAVMLGAVQAANASDWGVYGGDTGNTRFSDNKQVNAGNVSKLSVKWALQLGTNRSQESTPIIVGDTMYVTSSFGPKNVFAVDDLGIQQAMIKLYKIKYTTKKELHTKMLAKSVKWAPYKTYACLHLWNWKDNGAV